MSDELPYTINDPSSVECPYCHDTTEYDDQMVEEISDYPDGQNTSCPNCGRTIKIQVRIDVSVLAWKVEE